jgi:P-type Cu2+ transporter
VIEYDVTAVTESEVLYTLGKIAVAVSPAEESDPDVEANASVPRVPRLVTWAKEALPSWLPPLLGAAALGATLLRLPSMVPRMLLAAAVIPIVGRAAHGLFQDRRLNVDALDSGAALAMIATGSTGAGAVMAMLIGVGEFVRDLTARRSQAIMTDLLGLKGRSAWVVRGRSRVRVPAEHVLPGETVVVYPGDLIVVDGQVIRGRASIDQRSITGEAMPAEVAPGDDVYAASVVLDGKIYLTCQASGEGTQASQAVDLMRTAPIYETRTQNYASLMADRFVVPTFIASGALFLVTRNLTRALSLLIMDFATGIRVSAPTAVLASMQRAARRGVIIKSGASLERLAAVDAVVFDKTGTLTYGEPHVTKVIAVNGLKEDEVLSLAAASELRLNHPAARAVVRFAHRRSIPIPDRGDSSHKPGLGVVAEVNGSRMLVGNRALIESEGIEMGPIEAAQRATRARGESLAYVAKDGTIVGLISYADHLRAEAQEVIAELRRRGVREVLLVTGDSDAPARAAAKAAGITEVISKAFPADKAEIVQRLKAAGRTVAAVGDGINDSAALAYADVAISLGAGADVARERADVVLSDNDLMRLPDAIDTARQAMGLVRQNLAIVGVPNALGMGLATLGLAGPVISTFLNNGSAVVAALNSLRPLHANNGAAVI